MEEGGRRGLSGSLPAGSGDLAGKETLGWVGKDGNVQSLRLRKIVIGK